MTVLVDTSVWVDHFRRPNAMLAELMVQDQVLTHPLVVGELACGTPPEPRLRTLGDMALLLPADQAAPGEVRDFIEREALFGLGCGLIDLTLLASTLITQSAQLWTLDKRLASLSARYGVCFVPPMH
ncbi:MAG: VapC toxin family PIN domain ribonuclease [Comamonadaceae bacterium CG1_02_60_18]|nr:MAG: VapC toxin family PIN domain ribonuclease [Comamonadaceae bacterium CG1_02_60_18]PIQ53127.1 MAG: VapC toxin family PIN domain ribonuclease [Comamonadaceae bacterium CG12_big_fil_rev_8_21_14_0_65_59_15]